MAGRETFNSIRAGAERPGVSRLRAVAGTQATRRMTGMLTRLATILSLARNALIERLNVPPANGYLDSFV